MKRWKKMILSCFVIGIVWSFGSTCMADQKKMFSRAECMDELQEEIEEELKQGHSSFTIYIYKEIETAQLQEINSRLDGFYGYVESYNQWRFPFVPYYKTEFTLNISDNYYVLSHLKEGYSLKKDQKKARQLAKKIKEIQDHILTEGMSEYEKVLTVHDYLADHSAYEEKADQKSESDEYTAYGVLVNQKGVCSGYTQAFQLLMELNEIPSRIVLGKADNVRHSWNMVCLDQEWYHVDTTWDDPVPDEENRRIYAYFNVTDDFMEQSHTWEHNRYPSATGTKYNYYVQNNSVIESPEAFIQYVREKIENQETMITCKVEQYREQDYGSSLFQKVMTGTGVSSLDLQMFGEGEEQVFLLIPDYGGITRE